MQRVILAYSGGLVNTVAIHWLRAKKRLRVVTVSAELGQGGDLEELAETALMNGAESAHIADLRDTFLNEFVFPTLQAGATYEGSYMLSTALSRPLIAREMVRLAREEGCEYLAHGAWGRSNDQVRYETTVSSLAPELKVLSPRREWAFRDMDEIRAYADRHHIHFEDSDRHTLYTRDRNIWGCRVTGGELEDPAIEPPEDIYRLTRNPLDAPDEPAVLTLDFRSGIPCAIDGEELEPLPLVQRLNDIGGTHGVGRVDHLENRLLGTKVREIYEKPAAAICYTALQALEKLTMSARALHVKPRLADEYAELVYSGLWYSDMREALGAFFERIMRQVSGSVRLRLYKGTVTIIGTESPWSLYQREMSTISRFDTADQAAVSGWLQLASSQERHASKVRRGHRSSSRDASTSGD